MQNILISGGSSGIGAAIIDKFLSNNYIVHNLDIKNNNKFSPIDNYHYYALDITNKELLEETI
jgi:NADP-dependent 3-hydroxy acid dehydrogenase YdfG